MSSKCKVMNDKTKFNHILNTKTIFLNYEIAYRLLPIILNATG